MKCYRCNKDIEHPDETNADYIMAADTNVDDAVEVMFAVIPDNASLEKNAETRVEVTSLKEAAAVSGLKRLETTVEVRKVQKTGIVCPGCYRPTDFIIWGVHKRV